MATTVNPTKSRSTTPNDRNGVARGARPRVRGRRRGGAAASESREGQYDLLTAALVGLAIGAGTTLLLRRGPSGERPLGPAWRVAQKGARLAGRGARYAWDRGVDAWDRLPREEIEDHVRDYFESAKETIDDLVHTELKDLRRAIRRQRDKIGL
jgi:hypothetical protein